MAKKYYEFSSLDDFNAWHDSVKELDGYINATTPRPGMPYTTATTGVSGVVCVVNDDVRSLEPTATISTHLTKEEVKNKGYKI